MWDFYDFFVAIVWIFILVGSFNKVFEGWRREEKELQDYLNSDEPQEATAATVHYENASPMTQNDWDVICRTAIENAKSGDHRAREWVMKNVISGQATQPSFVQDAIDAMIGIGFSKKDAESKVRKLMRVKSYDNLDDLIKDAVSHK